MFGHIQLSVQFFFIKQGEEANKNLSRLSKICSDWRSLLTTFITII